MAVSNAIAAVRLAMLALSANPLMLIIAAIAALVVAFVTAYERSEWFRNVVNAAIGGLVSGVRFALQGLVDFVKWIWPTLTTIFGWPIKFWVNIVYDGGIHAAVELPCGHLRTRQAAELHRQLRARRCGARLRSGPRHRTGDAQPG